MAYEKFLLHLGLPKTATTTLQNYFSREIPGYVGKPSTSGSPDLLRRVRMSFEREDPAYWSTLKSLGLRMAFARAFKQAARISGRGVVTFSWEGAFISSLFMNHHYDDSPGNERRGQELDHLEALFRNTFRALPSTTILFTIRRQPEWLASLYAQVSARIDGASQADFEDQILRMLNQPTLPRPLDYFRLVEETQRAFPESSISILPLELIDSDFFREALGGWLGRDAPPADVFRERLNQRATSQVSWNLQRKNLRLRYQRIFRVSRIQSIVGDSNQGTISLHSDLVNRILQKVERSNAQLQEQSSIPLPGYFRKGQYVD